MRHDVSPRFATLGQQQRPTPANKKLRADSRRASTPAGCSIAPASALPRAVGENPAAADTAGVRVERMRYLAVVCCGALCGLAGAYLSIAQGAGFIRDMTAGKGYIALAALVFAKWKPMPALGACFLFGFLDAVAIRLQGQPVPGLGVLPVQLMQALPYVLTVALLAGFVGRATPPRAGGVPYRKER